MIVVPLLLAAAIPFSFESESEVVRYIQCVRNESREPVGRDDFTGEFAPGNWPTAMIPSFAHTIRYCQPLREPALGRAKAIVSKRHPEWPQDSIDRAAETILSRVELGFLRRSLALPMTSHGEIEDY